MGTYPIAHAGCSPYFYWLANNRIAFISADRHSLVVTTLQSGQASSISLPFGIVLRMNFSPNEHYALLELSDNCSSSARVERSLYLAALPAAEFIPLNGEGVIPLVGTDAYNEALQDIWTADSALVLLATEDKLILLDPDTLLINEIRLPESGRLAWFRFTDPHTLDFTWVTQYSSTTYAYDLDSKSLTPVYIGYISAAPSPDSQYIALTGINSLGIFDNATQSINPITFEPPPNTIITTVEANMGAILWHPEQSWLFAVSSRPNGFLTILNPATGFQRRVDLCSFEESCFGWLPQS
jgi:hypothetical protein